jgi:2,5-diketo-D-gluconate reductase A
MPSMVNPAHDRAFPNVPTVALNDGNRMPCVGFGTSGIWDDDAPRLVGEAIAAGYTLVDTASCYVNENGVGTAVREAATNGRSMFVTTKLWNTEHGFDAALRAFDASRQRLGVDTIDLYMIHWPVPSLDLYVDSWRALARLKKDGAVRSIGVSNFTVPHLQRLIDATGIVPAVNQIELHPQFQQRAQRQFHAKAGIVTEAWSPLGFGKALASKTVSNIAGKHGRSAAQVVIRWHIQSGNVVIPKTTDPARLRENIDVFDFALDADDIAAITALDDPAGRIGPRPDLFGIEGAGAKWRRRIMTLLRDPANIGRRLKRLARR